MRLLREITLKGSAGNVKEKVYERKIGRLMIQGNVITVGIQHQSR